MRRLAAVALAVVLAGCSVGGDGRAIEVGELKRLVLQPADVGRVFIQFDEGRQVQADNPGGRRAERDRFGREDGWKARYRRSGTVQTPGPLVIESRVDVFDSSAGPEEELDAAAADLREGTLPWQEVDAPRLGDEAHAVTLVQGTGPTAVRYYSVFWREANVAASVVVNGFDRRLDLEDALALARKQADRISRAAES